MECEFLSPCVCECEDILYLSPMVSIDAKSVFLSRSSRRGGRAEGASLWIECVRFFG